MPVPDDNVISPIANQLLTCLKAEVAKVSVPPQKVGFRTGNIVAMYISLNEDECCEGLAWVRWAGGFPSETLGEPLAAPNIGGRNNLGFWTLNFELGVARCAPTSGATTNPTIEAWNTASELVFEDQAALRRTYCCFNDLPRRKGKTLIQDTSPIDTEGGCSGSTLTLATLGPSCEC